MRRDPVYALDPEPYEVSLIQIVFACAIWGVVGFALAAQ
jgi:hypothetical protein